MGYDNEHAGHRIILDIETAPLPEAASFLEPVEAPSNYKDPTKIEEFVRTKQREQLERAALDVDLCHVIAIGFLAQGGEAPNVLLAKNEEMERALLEAFFLLAQHSLFVGFNILQFDLPVLLRRALYLGVKAPKVLLGKYRHPRVLDVMQELSYDGLLKYRSQAFYCKRFGIDVEDDEFEGIDIPHLFRVGNFEAVTNHVRCDVLQVRALAERVGFWPPNIRREHSPELV